MRAIVGWAMVCGLLACGCGESRKSEVPVIEVGPGDAAVNAAIERAQATLDQFIAALNSPTGEKTSLSVKAPFKDGERTEHMWLSQVSYDGQNFAGAVDNDPDQLTNVKAGERVTVKREDISDWMYVEKGKLVGGYTIRALRDSVPAAERAELEKAMPFTFD